MFPQCVDHRRNSGWHYGRNGLNPCCAVSSPEAVKQPTLFPIIHLLTPTGAEQASACGCSSKGVLWFFCLLSLQWWFSATSSILFGSSSRCTLAEWSILPLITCRHPLSRKCYFLGPLVSELVQKWRLSWRVTPETGHLVPMAHKAA